MIIEIQIRAELLRRIVRNRFLGRVICIPELPGPGKQVVDHLDFGQATLAREVADMPVRLSDGTMSMVPGHRVRLTQPVTVHVATHAQIIAGVLKDRKPSASRCRSISSSILWASSTWTITTR